MTANIFGLGYLEWVSGELVKGVNASSGDGEVRLLNAIVDPFVDLIIQVYIYNPIEIIVTLLKFILIYIYSLILTY